MNTRRFGWTLAGTVGLVVSGGCSDGGETAAEVPDTEFRIANGDLDNDNEFPYVAKISGPVGCSGILISPGLLLTANHCFRNDGLAPSDDQDFTDDDWNIGLGAGPFPENLAIQRTHTYSFMRRGVPFTQPVVERIGEGVNSATKYDPSQDLAIMRLDKRVPLSEVTPMHVPLAGYPRCDDELGPDFEGIIVGFGQCEMPNAAATCPGDPDAGGNGYPRTFNSVSHWGREDDMPGLPSDCFPAPFCYTSLPGALYSTYWPLIAETTGTYTGSLSGDSGGPLISEQTFPNLMPGASASLVGNHGGRILCGVDSRHYPVMPTDMFPPPDLPMTGNDFAAVDGDGDYDDPDDEADDNDHWLAPLVIANDGNFIGECFAGDATNPAVLALRDKDADDDLIPDMCDPCPEYYDNDYNAGLAIGLDADDDGVPDRCDSCVYNDNPLAIETIGSDVFRRQPDSDRDGVGDACDICSNSDEVVVPPDAPEPFSDYTCCTTDADCGVGPLCQWESQGDGPPVPLPEFQKCFPGDTRGNIIDEFGIEPCANHCAFPPDVDCDQAGDNCDVCPEQWNAGQEDTDLDGVGDICDNCKGTEELHVEDLNDECDYFHPPLGDAQCAALHPGSVCLPPHPNDDGDASTNVARCSLVTDGDGDGFGDACDDCATAANSAGSNGEQKNCNIVTEIVEGVPYPYIGDACDRNPCSPFRVDKVFQSQAMEDIRGWVARIDFAPRLLPEWQPADPYYGPAFGIQCVSPGVHCQNPRATTGMRFCNCYSTAPDGSFDIDECQAQGCTIDSSHYASSQTWWKPSLFPQDVVINGGDGPYLAQPEIGNQPMINPVPDDPNTSGALLPEDTLKTSSAYWYTRDDIAAHGGGTQIEGILWSHVTNVTYLLPNAATAELQYRPWSNHYRGGVFGPPEPDGMEIPVEATDYIYMGCPLKEIGMSQIGDTPTVVVEVSAAPIDDPYVGLHSTDGNISLEGSISTEAARAFGQHGVRWVSANDRPASCENMPVLASLANDGMWVTSVLGGLDNRMVELGASIEPDANAVGRVDYGAALSATEGSLFIVGGTDAETGDLVDTMWRYDVAGGTWTDVALVGELPERVLATSYRAEDRALYVVDVSGDVARLLRIDLAARDVRSLGSWTHRSSWERMYLSNVYDGRMLLTVSSEREGYIVIAFDLAEDLTRTEGPAFLSTTGRGMVAVQPTLTEAGLTLPTFDARDGVENVFIPMGTLLADRNGDLNRIAECM